MNRASTVLYVTSSDETSQTFSCFMYTDLTSGESLGTRLIVINCEHYSYLEPANCFSDMHEMRRLCVKAAKKKEFPNLYLTLDLGGVLVFP